MARAQFMDLPRNEAFACATLSLEHDGTVCWGDHGHHFLNLVHGRASAYDVGVLGFLLQALFQVEVLNGEFPVSQDPVDYLKEFIRREGLCNEIKSTELDGLNSRFNGAVPCDNDDNRLRIPFLDCRQNGEAVFVRHLEIEKNEIERPPLQQLETFTPAFRQGYAMTMATQSLVTSIPQECVVVHNQNVITRFHLLRCLLRTGYSRPE